MVVIFRLDLGGLLAYLEGLFCLFYKASRKKNMLLGRVGKFIRYKKYLSSVLLKQKGLLVRYISVKYSVVLSTFARGGRPPFLPFFSILLSHHCHILYRIVLSFPSAFFLAAYGI